MKTALVTGASGYLGGHVARRLIAEGWQVVALLRPDSRPPADLEERVVRVDYDGTLRSVTAALAKAPIDVVVHLASAVVADHAAGQLDDIIDANIRFPSQILEAMRTSRCKRMVNTGTFWQHCNSDDYAPVNLYAATKQAFEDIARAYADNDGIGICTLVLFDSYGSDDPRRKIVRLLIDAIGAEEPLQLSAGKQILDLTHAQDIAEAFAIASKRIVEHAVPSLERFRVSGTRLSLEKVVRLVAARAAEPLNVVLGARPYRAREIMVPVERTVPPLPGWTPRRELAVEIDRMIAEGRSPSPAAP